jgi:hypothetical protein
MRTKTTVSRISKKFLILFIILASAFVVDGQDKSSADKIAEKDKSTDIYGARFVNIEIAQSYVRRYQKRKQHKVNKWAMFFGGHKDAYNIFFDMNKLQRIIDTAIIVTTNKKTVFCGLRFYYAKYPRNYRWTNKQSACCVPASNTEHKYGLMHTLLIVPQECDTTKEEKIIQDITALDRGNKFILAYGVKEVIAENQGTLCPPLSPSYCKGTELMKIRRSRR